MNVAIKLTGVVVTLLGLAAIIQADETKGTIKKVDTARQEVTLKGTVSDSTYEMEKSATVWLDGVRCKLGDLVPDDRAVIDYQKKGDHLMVMQVRGLRKAKETTGTINDVFGEKREVTIKGTIKNTTYELKKDGTVYVDGKQNNLKGIHAGDQVLITYEQHGDRWIANDVTLLKRK